VEKRGAQQVEEEFFVMSFPSRLKILMKFKSNSLKE